MKRSRLCLEVFLTYIKAVLSTDILWIYGSFRLLTVLLDQIETHYWF